MNWLAAVPAWCWWLIALVLVAGGQQYRVVVAQGETAEARTELSDYRLQVAERDRRAAAQARTEEQWGEKRYEQGLHVQYPGEEYPRPEFFVQMIAYNKDRQRPSTDSKRGEPPIPVLYDSRQAYIIFEDGSRLNARPEVYVGLNDIYDYPSVNERAARPSPYDINSDEVHRMIPKLTNNNRYGSAYVIFQTDKLKADSKWTIHLGSLQVQGRTVAMPPLQLCYHPVKKWIGIEPLIKP